MSPLVFLILKRKLQFSSDNRAKPQVGFSESRYRDGVCDVRFFFFFFFKDSLRTKERDIAILGQRRSMACLAGE